MTGNNDIESRSLCSSCKHAVGCCFRKDRQRPSFYCEEFEIDSGPVAKTAKKAKPSPTYSLDPEHEASKSMGLCSNCDNRKTCSFAEPEGGVWHCEEYK